jgi:hypothetical protein
MFCKFVGFLILYFFLDVFAILAMMKKIFPSFKLFPLFILGNPRSGTSLLRIMLTCHPEICIPPECGFAQWLYGKYKNWQLGPKSYKFIAKDFVNDLKNSKKIETWNLNFREIEKQISSQQPECYADLVYTVYLQFMLQTKINASILGDKNNYYIKHLDILNSIFPNASYLFIVRDGRDIACSYRGLHKIKTKSIYKPVLPTAIDKIAAEWSRNNKAAVNFLSAIDRQRWHAITYEELIKKPENTLNRICSWLNIAFSTEMLDFHKHNRELKIEPIQTLDWKTKTLQPLDPQNIGKFRINLSPSEIMRFEEISFEMMKHFSYKFICLKQ